MGWFVDEAIEQGMKTTDVYADAAPISAGVMRFGISWLRQAQRFRICLPLIPHGAEETLLAMQSRYALAVTSAPPSKFTVFEYEHGGHYGEHSDLTRALSTKRIALCIDMVSERAVTIDASHEVNLAEGDRGALMIWPVTYFDEKRDWEFAAGAAIIPKGPSIDYLQTCQTPLTFWERITRSLPFQPVAPPEDPPLAVMYQEMLPEIVSQLGKEHRLQAISQTAMDAAWAVLGMLSSMQCGNTRVDPGGDSLSVNLSKEEASARWVPVDPFHGKSMQDGVRPALWSQESSTHFD